MKCFSVGVLISLAVGFSAAVTVHAAEAHSVEHKHAVANTTAMTPEQKNAGLALLSSDRQIANVEVLDHNGDTLQFYEALIADRIVAMNFVFTRCQLSCPLMGFKFGLLRNLLQQRSLDSIKLVSVSTDAPNDTPLRMRSWADQFNNGDGWTQVTGRKQNLDRLLKSLDAFSADITEHSSLVLLINDKTRQRKWIDGNSDPETILTALLHW